MGRLLVGVAGRGIAQETYRSRSPPPSARLQRDPLGVAAVLPGHLLPGQQELQEILLAGLAEGEVPVVDGVAVAVEVEGEFGGPDIVVVNWRPGIRGSYCAWRGAEPVDRSEGEGFRREVWLHMDLAVGDYVIANSAVAVGGVG